MNPGPPSRPSTTRPDFYVSLRSATSVLVRLFGFWGIDRAIAYTLLGRGWASLSGVATLAFVVRFLSPVQQGYYYTFGSILALQVFLDLGLSYVVMQFASHEVAQLRLSVRGIFEGDQRAKARMASLIRASMTWYSVVALLAILAILPTGLLMFSRNLHEGPVAWLVPWVWFVPVAVMGTLVLGPLLAILEGCGLVAEVALVRFVQAIFGSLVLWIALWQGLALLSLALFETSKLLVGCTWLAWRHRRMLSDLVSTRLPGASIDWWKEVWPLQWKIALTAVNGYLVYQLFVPVLFTFDGPVVAGQMGVSLTVSMAILSLSMAWISTKAAPFGTMIARREYSMLDRVFSLSLSRSLMLLVSNSILFWGVVCYLNAAGHSLSQRLIAPLPLGLLMVTGIINHVVFAEAVYLRAHKQEPLLITSLLIGTCMGLSTYFLGRSYGVIGMTSGYFVVMLVIGLGGSTWIFFQKRRLWHAGGF